MRNRDLTGRQHRVQVSVPTQGGSRQYQPQSSLAPRGELPHEAHREGRQGHIHGHRVHSHQRRRHRQKQQPERGLMALPHHDAAQPVSAQPDESAHHQNVGAIDSPLSAARKHPGRQGNQDAARAQQRIVEIGRCALPQERVVRQKAVELPVVAYGMAIAKRARGEAFRHRHGAPRAEQAGPVAAIIGMHGQCLPPQHRHHGA